MTALLINNQNELTGLDQQIRATLESSISKNTARAYKKTLTAFGNRPFTEVSILAFLQERALSKKLNTVKQDLAAISFYLRMQQNTNYTVANSVKIRQFMKGLSRIKAGTLKKAKPITAERIKEILEIVPSYRDRALLLIGWSGALRRSEITAIRVSDLEFLEAGMKLTIRKSKTDQEGKGQTIAIVNKMTIEAVIDWIEISGIESEDFLFPGKLKGRHLTDQAAANIIKKYAGPEYSAHGLRSGFMTSAADNGAGLESIVEISRHKDLSVARGYIEEANKFKNNAGAGLL